MKIRIVRTVDIAAHVEIPDTLTPDNDEFFQTIIDLHGREELCMETKTLRSSWTVVKDDETEELLFHVADD